MKKYIMIFFAIVITMSCILGKTLVMANEEESPVSCNRYYTTVKVEPGDTLWSIAQTYNQNSGMDIRDYIIELKRINQLLTDEIRAGEYLSIVYFSETPVP